MATVNWSDTTPQVQPVTSKTEESRRNKQALAGFLEAVQKFNRDFTIERLGGSAHLGEMFFEAANRKGDHLPQSLRDRLMLALQDIGKRNIPDNAVVSEMNVTRLLKQAPGLPSHYAEGTPMESYLRDFKQDIYSAVKRLPNGDGSLKETLCLIGEAAQRSGLFEAIAEMYAQPVQGR